MLRGLNSPTPGPAVRGVGAVLLTLRPRGFSTFGLREKCMCRVPSSLTVTDTFFSVLLPQWAQNTRLMSDVVLQTQRSLTALEPQAANPVPGAQGESRASEEWEAREVEGDRLKCTALLDQGCPAVSRGRCTHIAAPRFQGRNDIDGK